MEYNSYACKANEEISSRHLYRLAFREDNLRCSLWAIGDVVLVEAFGQISKHLIVNVQVDVGGNFSYDIEDRFTVRHEDIRGLAGRRC
jgi:hypothetical protein